MTDPENGMLHTTLSELISPNRDKILRIASLCGGMVAFLGAAGLLGLFTSISLLSTIVPGYKPMSVCAGIAWILLGSLIFLFANRPVTGGLRAALVWVLGIVAVIGAMELPLNLMGKHLIIEEMLLRAGDLVSGQSTTHISPTTTSVIVLSSITLFILLYEQDSADRSNGRNIAGIIALIVLLTGITYSLSYLYGTPFLHGVSFIPISLISVLAVCFTGAGLVLLTGPQTFPLAYFTGTDTRARLLRIFIPLTLGVILIQNLVLTVIFTEFRIPGAVTIAISFVLFSVVISYAVGHAASNVSRTIDAAEQKRKQAEDRLRETNEYLANLINYSNTPIIVWDPKFQIIRFNRAFEYLTGRTEQEVIGQPLEILFPKGSRDSSLEKIQRTLVGERWETVEIPILDINGGIRIVLWNSANVLGSDGSIISTIAQGTDITDRRVAEDELKQSEERYRNVVEDQEEFICRFVPNGTHIFVNAAYCRYFSKSRDEILGHRFKPRIHPDDAGRVREFFTSLTTDHPVDMIEHRIIMPDGTVRWQRWSDRAIFNTQGILIEIQSVGRDFTREKVAELEVAESRQILADIIEFLPDATFVIDNQGTIITWNRAMEEISGIIKEAMIGKGNHAYSIPFYGEARPVLLDIMDSDDDTLKMHYKNLKRRGKALIAEVYAPQLYGGKGAHVWVTAAPLIDRNGAQIGAIESIRDITALKRSKTALARNERRLRMLFENMTEAVALHEIILDNEGNPVDYRFLSANQAFEQMTGFKADMLIGKTVREVLPGIEQSWIDRYGDVALTGKAIVFEDYNEDTKRYYRVTAYSPNLRQFACIFSDITEKRLADKQRETLIGELEQKNAELERFTYTVSHDLKSPLITIHGFLGMLEENLQKGDMPKIRRNIDRISSATEKMQELLSDLLELSRVGRFVNPTSSVPFEKIVLEAKELLAGKLEGQEIVVEIAPDMPVVCVDPVRLREAMVNLIENSVKFMGDQKTPRISIGVDKTPDQPVFYIRDNGIGIEQEYCEKVFGLFEKLDARSNGTGIGLAIVHRIIEIHGGRIWIESMGANQGTTVFFTLPVSGSTCLYNPADRTKTKEPV